MKTPDKDVLLVSCVAEEEVTNESKLQSHASDLTQKSQTTRINDEQ